MRIPRIPRFPRLFPGPRWSEREANVHSLMAVPRSILPDGPARRFLVSAAMNGEDVYAYAPLQDSAERERRWNIWYGPLAPRYDARIDARTWAQFWPDLVTKAHPGGTLRVPLDVAHAMEQRGNWRQKGGDVR